MPRDTSLRIEHGAPSAEPVRGSADAGVRRTASRWKDVLVSLTVADLKVRYGRGAAPLVKWIADPLAVLGVYLALITLVVDRPGEAPGLSLACAVVPFQLVITTVVNAMTAVSIRRAIVLNMRFNRTLLPLSATLTEAVAFGPSLLLVAIMMAIYGVAPTAATLWLPVVIAVNLLFALGIAYPVSLLGVWLPDIKNFVFSFVRVLFFLAPGLVPLSSIPGSARDLLQINPLTGIFESYRDTLMYGDAPGAFELLYPAAIGLLLLAAFLPVYRSEQRQFAKVIEPG